MGIWDPVLYGDAGSGACGSWGLGVQIWGICTPVVGVAVLCSGVGAGQERSLMTCIGSESSQARVGQESRPAGHLTFRLN